MFTDEHRGNLWEQIRQRDLRPFARLLPDTLLVEAAARAGVSMGRGALNLATLTWLGLSSALQGAQSFGSILTLVLKLLHDAEQFSPEPALTTPGPKRHRKDGKRRKQQRRKKQRQSQRSKHDPHGNGRDVSEEAFVQARRRMPPGFWVALILLLGKAFERQHGRRVRYRGLRLLALDGTCINLPRWKRLKEHFGVAANGKGNGTAQARMVMLQFPLVRLPWRYELAPIAQGERTVAARLLAGLLPDDLVLMDKGFWSYGLFRQIHDQEAFFAIRLILGGLNLRTVRRLGNGDRVVRWMPSSRQWKKPGLAPSIELRVIDYQIKGFRPSAIVTNLTDPRRMSRQQWLGLAGTEAGRTLETGLYHHRWQIETTFCELKVRQGMEGSLRGRTPQAIAYEVAGHVLLYLLTRWLMVEAALEHGKEPLRLSFLGAWREINDMGQSLLTASEQRVRCVLLPRLLARIAEHGVPLRPGRHYPRPGDTKVRYNGAGKRMLPSKLACEET